MKKLKVNKKSDADKNDSTIGQEFFSDVNQHTVRSKKNYSSVENFSDYYMCRNIHNMEQFHKEVENSSYKFVLRLFGRNYYVIKDQNYFEICSKDKFDKSNIELLINVARNCKLGDRPILYPGSVPVVGTILGTPWSAGVCLVVASGDSGKSPLCKALVAASGEPYAMVRAGEPLALYDTDPDDVAFNIISYLVSDYHYAVFDSIKDIIAMGGSLMKQGVSRQALVEISSLSSLCCTLGKAILVPFNVSSDDPEMIDGAIEMARSNATGYLTFTSVDDTTSLWTGSMRKGEGLPRFDLSVFFGKKGELKIVDNAFGGSIDDSFKSAFDEAKSVAINIEKNGPVFPFNLKQNF